MSEPIQRRPVILAAAGLVTLLAACGSQGIHQAAAHTTAASPAAAPAATPACLSQFTAWRAGGGLADLQAVTHALGHAARAAGASAAAGVSSASLMRLGTAAAALQAATQTAQADPAPACVPGLSTDEGTAMADLTQGAQGELDAIQAAQNGDIQTAGSDLVAAAGTINSAHAPMLAAVSDIQAFLATH